MRKKTFQLWLCFKDFPSEYWKSYKTMKAAQMAIKDLSTDAFIGGLEITKFKVIDKNDNSTSWFQPNTR